MIRPSPLGRVSRQSHMFGFSEGDAWCPYRWDRGGCVRAHGAEKMSIDPSLCGVKFERAKSHIVDQFGGPGSSARLQQSDQSAAEKEIELTSVTFPLCPTTNQGSHLKRRSWEVVVVGDAKFSLDPGRPFLPAICDLMGFERRLRIPESRPNFRSKRRKEENTRG
mmetsp:Transcript_4403/g.5239  ORF Transcript_4403/g.5239 Transcript_4403/m.5239 type:complete len:165 (+) Transcript_4403:896-1390(+)